MQRSDKYRLAEQFRRMHQIMASLPGRAGISHSEFCIMNIIRNGREDITVSEIASELDVTPPAVSRSLKFMESRGFIRRETDSVNRRNTMVRLTVKGSDILDRARNEIDSITEMVNTEMGAERIDQLYRLIAEMTEIYEKYAKVKGENADDKDT
ncbi:MAG: MarR family transcriptional regulator [Oscillospiraceae bacterium]|nr:MarR family transcriptional regulator [Oscillospiraceae bacterium]